MCTDKTVRNVLEKLPSTSRNLKYWKLNYLRTYHHNINVETRWNKRYWVLKSYQQKRSQGKKQNKTKQGVTEEENKLLTNILTDNISKLNDLIYAGVNTVLW